jgi:cytosine/creatinine deaminase
MQFSRKGFFSVSMPSENVDWLLRNARVGDTPQTVDIAINNGLIKEIDFNLSYQGREEWNLNGSVVLPGLVDAHVHLDKTFSTTFNKSGTLQEAIEVWLQEKPHLTYEGYAARMMQALQIAVSKGTTHLRTHVDVDSTSGFAALEALLDVRERFKPIIDIQIVALGQAGVNDDETEAMQAALEMGADLIGGAPALTPNPEQSIDAVFALAERYDKPIDLHIDETEDASVLTLEYLAEKTIERNMQGRVTAGHCCSLAFVDDETADRVLEKVKQAKLHIITLPSCNLVLMGRGMNPVPRGITRVKELLGAGVNVAAASDNVRDPFNPLGNYDLLHIANLTAHAAHMTGAKELESCLAMITSNAAEVLGLEDYGLFEGGKADLVVVDAVNVMNTLAGVPERLATFKNGELVVRTEVHRTWRDV